MTLTINRISGSLTIADTDRGGHLVQMQYFGMSTREAMKDFRVEMKRRNAEYITEIPVR